MSYARPGDLAEALELLSRAPLEPLAGGTDLFPATQGQRLARPVLDLTGLAELSG